MACLAEKKRGKCAYPAPRAKQTKNTCHARRTARIAPNLDNSGHKIRVVSTPLAFRLKCAHEEICPENRKKWQLLQPYIGIGCRTSTSRCSADTSKIPMALVELTTCSRKWLRHTACETKGAVPSLSLRCPFIVPSLSLHCLIKLGLEFGFDMGQSLSTCQLFSRVSGKQVVRFPS